MRVGEQMKIKDIIHEIYVKGRRACILSKHLAKYFRQMHRY